MHVSVTGRFEQGAGIGRRWGAGESGNAGAATQSARLSFHRNKGGIRSNCSPGTGTKPGADGCQHQRTQ